MQSVILILVLIAAALVVASGVWVATALLRAIARPKTDPEDDAVNQRQPSPDDTSTDTSAATDAPP